MTASPQHSQQYDAIIIGSGQAAGPLATALAEAKWKVALVEREHVGGTCINEGCTPTKTMIASGRVAYLARRATDYGVHTGAVTVDMETVRKRKREIVESFRSGSEKSITQADGVDLLMGEARFIGASSVAVALRDGGDALLTAGTICINTGARPAPLTIPGADTVTVLNSTTIMELDRVPEHLIVIGGGVIAAEFGQLFRRLGSRVTIVQRGTQLLAREDIDVAAAMLDIFREDGIEVLLDTNAVRVAAQPGGGIALTVKTPDGERTLTGSHLLAAMGRTPNTDRLGLDAAGVTQDKRGAIPVDERLRTNVPHIYALGDVNGGPAYTHVSYDDFRIMRTNLIEKGDATTKDRLIPSITFTDPQLGRVGMSEAEARKAGREIRVAKIPMNYVARALETDEPRGLMKAVVDAHTEQILGAAVLGIEGGEVMSMLQIAMLGKLPYTALRDGIFAHPALAESLNTLFSTFEE